MIIYLLCSICNTKLDISKRDTDEIFLEPCHKCLGVKDFDEEEKELLAGPK